MIPLMNRPLAWLLGLLLTACSPAGEQVRERSSWNDDWKFALSDSVQDYSSPDSDDYRMIGVSRGISPSITRLPRAAARYRAGLVGIERHLPFRRRIGVRLFMLISTGFTGIARSGSMVIRWDSVRMVMYRFVMT